VTVSKRILAVGNVERIVRELTKAYTLLAEKSKGTGSFGRPRHSLEN